MSILAPPEGGSPPLDAVLRQAGAVFASHGGRAAAIHYGSAAGELAVCVSAVGLVDRSELTTLALQAPSAQLSQLTSRLAGGEVAPGGALDAAGAWWCGAAPDTVLVVCAPDVGRRLVDRLRVARRAPGRAACADRRLLGYRPARPRGSRRAARARCLRLGRRSAPGRAVRARSDRRGPRCGGCSSQTAARSCSPPTSKPVACGAPIERAGRPFGISCVGQEAAGRYTLLERTHSRAPALLR